MIENMHDVPYLNTVVGPEIVASMTIGTNQTSGFISLSCLPSSQFESNPCTVAQAVRNASKLPVGIQVLAAANKEAIAIAQAADLQFIRAEGMCVLDYCNIHISTFVMQVMSSLM